MCLEWLSEWEMGAEEASGQSGVSALGLAVLVMADITVLSKFC